MSYTIEPCESYVLVRYSGTFALNDLQSSRMEVAELLKSEGLLKILLDFTEAVPETSFIELFAFVGSHREEILPVIPTASVIDRAVHGHFYDYLDSLTDTFENPVKYFNTFNEAEEWLLSLS